MPNSVDPEQTPHSVASVLDLNRLLRFACPNTSDYYNILFNWANNLINGFRFYPFFFYHKTFFFLFYN